MKLQLFRILTGVVALYHIVLGLAGLLLPVDAFADVSGFILGLRPEVDAQFELTAKFAAAYALAFGALAGCLCLHPVRLRMLALPVLVLFGVRLINKLVFFGTIASSFDVPFARNLFATLSVAVLFFGILLTLPKAKDATT